METGCYGNSWQVADSGPREHMRCGHVMRDVTLADLGGHDGRRKVVFNVKENINCQSAFMSTSLCVFVFVLYTFTPD